MPTVLVALAGAVGAVLRYRIGLAVGVRPFPPWATLGVNLSGCFVLAALLPGPAQSGGVRPPPRASGSACSGRSPRFSTFG